MENIIITIIITTLSTMFIGGYYFDKAIENKEKALKKHYSFEIDVLKYSIDCQSQLIENLREKLNKKREDDLNSNLERLKSVYKGDCLKVKQEPIKASDIIDPKAFVGIKKDIEDVIDLLEKLEKKLKDLGK